MFQPQKRQQWFFRHLPWREMSQVKALVLPEGSAGVWWLVCGTPFPQRYLSVSCPRGVHCRGARKLLQSWIHLNWAEAAHQSPRAEPQRGGRFKHLRQTLVPVEHNVSCRLQKSAVSHWELPPTAPSALRAEGWQARQRGEFCAFAPLMELGGFLTPLSRGYLTLPPEPQPPGSDLS